MDGKYPFLPAVWAGNGRLKANIALFRGTEKKVVGSYYLRFTDNGQRRFEPVGGDASAVVVAARKKETSLKAKAAGITVVEEGKSRLKLADAIAAYKEETKEHKAWATYRAYCTALDLFVQGCPKTYVDEVGRDCIMAFAAALKKRYAERTVANRFGYVYTFLKRSGKAGIVGKTDWPKYEDVEYEIYSEENVQKMLAACETVCERALILLASGTGFRHGEISHAEVADVNFEKAEIQTRSKSQWKFKTKDHEQRIVPMSDSLHEVMKKHCSMVEGTLLFPTSSGKPDSHLNRILARIAKRAKVTMPSKPMHAFRALYATRLVRQNVDVYTVQRLLGHSDIATTLGYLRAVKRSDPTLRKQINEASF
jgi:integrase